MCASSGRSRRWHLVAVQGWFVADGSELEAAVAGPVLRRGWGRGQGGVEPGYGSSIYVQVTLSGRGTKDAV
jgi:hypothetical protein